MFTLFCQYNENEWGTKQRTFMVIQKKKKDFKNIYFCVPQKKASHRFGTTWG